MSSKWKLCEIDEVPHLIYQGCRVQVCKGGDIDYYFDIDLDSNQYVIDKITREPVPTHPYHEFRYWEEDQR